ncbi:MAG: hypothetical protein HQL32_11420 [Planctomycetes bacterium]|nr:hypothetical protein [Planctomycetota bacterium]
MNLLENLRTHDAYYTKGTSNGDYKKVYYVREAVLLAIYQIKHASSSNKYLVNDQIDNLTDSEYYEYMRLNSTEGSSIDVE